MSVIELDERLKRDTYLLGYLGDTRVLLTKNAHFPWFILVPDTRETEFYQLPLATQQQLLERINQLCHFLKSRFTLDKLNIATLGNIVSQLHIHVVGRQQGDVCWPGVVWGCDQFKEYAEGVVEGIRDHLELDLAGVFSAAR
jgi:diadenosine tetraphosphate (Ap4A) HIT family hydrolase